MRKGGWRQLANAVESMNSIQLYARPDSVEHNLGALHLDVDGVVDVVEYATVALDATNDDQLQETSYVHCHGISYLNIANIQIQNLKT